MTHCLHASVTILLIFSRIPEVPPDTAETNTLMDVNNFPDWSKITPSSVYRGCGKLAILFETHLAEHCEKLKGGIGCGYGRAELVKSCAMSIF